MIVPKHRTSFAIPMVITIEMCLCSGLLPSKPDLYDGALMGVGSHTMSNYRKGQGNATYPDGHISLLYQTHPHTIEP